MNSGFPDPGFLRDLMGLFFRAGAMKRDWFWQGERGGSTTYKIFRNRMICEKGVVFEGMGWYPPKHHEDCK
jgi:hypothetical protein